MLILAPISVGELLDKITILEVKHARIAGAQKRANVARELAELRRIAERHLDDDAGLAPLVAALREVNGLLWDIEDGKRAAEARGMFDAAFVRLARDVYLENDRRAAIKRAINARSGSTIVEEKSHAGPGLQGPGEDGTSALPGLARQTATSGAAATLPASRA